MKIIPNKSIRKYVVGGVAYTPFNPYATDTSVDVGTTSGDSTTDSSKKKSISGTMTDKIIDIVKQNGLPNDVNVFLKQVGDFLTQSSNLSSAYLFGGDQDYSLSQVLQIQSMANEVRHNNELYKQAYQNIESEDIGSSLAINTNGLLYVIDANGKLNTVSINDFDQEKHRALTNSELMGLRTDPKNFGLAMNTTILSDLQYSKGLKSVTDYIRTTVSAFENNSSGRYITKDEESIRKGIEALTGTGPNGYYKYSSTVKIEDMNKAISFLYSTLDDEMKNRLRAESIRYGMKPNEFVKQFIQQSLNEYNEIDTDVDFDESATEYDPTGRKKGGSGNSSGTMVTDTLGEAYSTGQGFAPPHYTVFMTSNSGVPMYALTQNMGPIQTSDGSKAFGNANVEDVLTNSAGLPLMGLDKNAITFGDIPVDWIDVSKLVYDSSSELNRVWLPYINDGGKIRPNFALIKRIDELNELYINGDKKTIMNPGQINSIIGREGLYYDEKTGKIVAKDTMPFISFGAIASNDTFGKELSDASWLHACTDKEDSKWKDLYNDLTEYRSFYADAKDKEKTGRPKTTWWMGYKFYKGNIFIPIIDASLASRTYNDNYYPRETYTNTTQKMMAHQAQQFRSEITDNSDLILNF